MTIQIEVTIDGIEWPNIKNLIYAIRPDLVTQNGMICARVSDPVWTTVEIISGYNVKFILVDKNIDGQFHVCAVRGDRVYIDNDMKLLYYGTMGCIDNGESKVSRVIFGAYVPKPA